MAENHLKKNFIIRRRTNLFVNESRSKRIKQNIYGLAFRVIFLKKMELAYRTIISIFDTPTIWLGWNLEGGNNYFSLSIWVTLSKYIYRHA